MKDKICKSYKTKCLKFMKDRIQTSYKTEYVQVIKRNMYSTSYERA